MKQSFVDLEEKYSIQNMNSTENILNREMDYLDQLLQDWGFWDDTYYFTKTGSADYIESNLPEETFYAASLNLIYIFNIEGDLIWGEVYDLENEENITTDLFTATYINTEIIFINDEDFSKEKPEDLVRKGYMDTESGLLMIASRPILKSDLSGSSAGTIVMGKFITSSYQDNLKEMTQNDFNIYIKNDLSISEAKSEIINEIHDSGELTLMRKNKNTVINYKILKDIYGNQGILLESFYDRAITQYGSQSIRVFRISILIFLAAITFFLIFIFDKVFTNPIRRMTFHLKSVQSSGETSAKLQFERNDEIGFLAKAVDKFVETIDTQKEELVILNDELKKQATTDALTGLFNRHVIGENLQFMWKRHSRDQSEITVILIDIDYFKKYNDTYGHPMGDECIKAVAQLIKDSLHRSTDLPIRYGGEEFLILLPSTNIEGGIKVAETIKEAVSAERIEHKTSDISNYLSISLGIAATIPSSTNNLEELIEKADKALYESKTNGRDRISMFITKFSGNKFITVM